MTGKSREGGRPKHEAHEMKRELELYFRDHPNTILQDGQKMLKEEFDIDTSTATIRRIMKTSDALGNKYRITRPVKPHALWKPKREMEPEVRGSDPMESVMGQAMLKYSVPGVYAAREKEMAQRKERDDGPRKDEQIEALRRELVELKEKNPVYDARREMEARKELEARREPDTRREADARREETNGHTSNTGDNAPEHSTPPETSEIASLRRELNEAKERMTLLETQMKLLVRVNHGRALGGTKKKQRTEIF